MSLESKDATCVGSLCERANSHGTRDFAGDTDLQAPFRNADFELDLNSSNLSATLTMGIMLLRRFVSSFCILKSLGLVLYITLLQISVFTRVLIRFSQFSGLLYFSCFHFADRLPFLRSHKFGKFSEDFILVGFGALF